MADNEENLNSTEESEETTLTESEETQSAESEDTPPEESEDTPPEESEETQTEEEKEANILDELWGDIPGSRLTSEGYVKRSPSALKEALVERLKQKYTTFFEQPADIQNMILDTSLQSILEFENLCAEMINAYAPFYQNDFMFKQLASSLGLTPKAEYKSQVLLEFSGNYGDFIPKGVRVGTFETTEDAIIPTSGSVLVLALSEDEEVSPPNTLTELVEPLTADISVTNPQSSLAYIPAETIEQLKQRAQEILRSPRLSSREYARARLASLKGVNPRLINFREVEFFENIDSVNTRFKGIECVCGGGDPAEVGKILFSSFIDTQSLISMPSDSDASRTQEIPVNYYGLICPVRYTLPKLLNLELDVWVTFKGAALTATNVQSIIARPLLDYVNNRIVGSPLNKVTLENIIVNTFKNEGVASETLQSLQIKPTINGFVEDWDATNYLPSIGFDCYTTLTKLTAQIK